MVVRAATWAAVKAFLSAATAAACAASSLIGMPLKKASVQMFDDARDTVDSLSSVLRGQTAMLCWKLAVLDDALLRDVQRAEGQQSAHDPKEALASKYQIVP